MPFISLLIQPGRKPAAIWWNYHYNLSRMMVSARGKFSMIFDGMVNKMQQNQGLKT